MPGRPPDKAMLTSLGFFLAYLGAFLTLGAQTEVEFKHHNNREMASVLQQFHSRRLKLVFCFKNCF